MLQDGFVSFKEFALGLLVLGGNSAATNLDDEALEFMFRYWKKLIYK